MVPPRGLAQWSSSADMMKKLDHASYESLVGGATVLVRDGFGDKVLDLNDGRVLKLFRRKRILSSNTLLPYAERFARSARELTSRKIATVEVLGTFSVPSIKRQAVLYRKAEGETLRSALQRAEGPATLLRLLAEFLALLHARGVYFRSVHFANVLVTPGRHLALIDVLETKFFAKGLSVKLRGRNFRHLTSYQVDREAIAAFGLTRFMDCYLEASNLRPAQNAKLLSYLAGTNPFFAGVASN